MPSRRNDTVSGSDSDWAVSTVTVSVLGPEADGASDTGVSSSGGEELVNRTVKVSSSTMVARCRGGTP
ncbi:MAG: hypothetical protein OXU61_10765, partial [Gammaproteobacteria bacterium]|nr:hypothetical protein [Gammaproteobacteria bacterium]